MEVISLFEQRGSLQDIQMVDLFPENGSSRAPFHIVHISVASNQRTQEHRHDESESFFIVKGEGSIDSEGRTQKVKAGDLIHFDPFESHSLLNRGGETLSFLSIYWRDYQRAFHAAKEETKQSDGPIYITSGPPTPNGDLHLGHLSGPFLGGDVCVRYSKMRGKEAYNISWSDDFQTGVLDKSEQIGLSPKQVADYFSEEIRQTLDAMNIQLDVYLRPLHSEEYRDGLARFFNQLYQTGAFIQKSTAEFFESESHEFLQEGKIKGYCPRCESPCTGNLCEECGHPHYCLDVVGAVSSRSKTRPVIKEIQRLFFPLRQFANLIKNHHDHATLRSRLRVLFDQFNTDQLPDFPITYPSRWGVAVPLESFADHKISAWFEMSFAFLFSIRELERRKGLSVNNFGLPNQGKIVHFFGFDNSFYYTVLFPAIYLAAFPNQPLQIDYVCNEFYSLEGSKFSTSRGHLIWGRDLLKEASPDEIRFYLAYTRPEAGRTNFTIEAFHEFIEQEFGRWGRWLLGVDAKIKEYFSGKVPEAGLWTHEHKVFFGSMEFYLQGVASSYEVPSFSLQRACRLISRFVDECICFSEAEKDWPLSLHSNPEFRTSMALELTAAGVLAVLTYPLMPEFATHLWRQLGHPAARNGISWPQIPPFAIANAQVDLGELAILKRGAYMPCPT